MDNLATKFPLGMRVRMTDFGGPRLRFMRIKSGGLGVVIGCARRGGLRILPDNYRWSTANSYTFFADEWEPTGEVWPRDKWGKAEPEVPADPVTLQTLVLARIDAELHALDIRLPFLQELRARVAADPQAAVTIVNLFPEAKHATAPVTPTGAAPL